MGFGFFSYMGFLCLVGRFDVGNVLGREEKWKGGFLQWEDKIVFDSLGGSR